MARPSNLESRPVFALSNGVDFGAVFAVGVAVLFAFWQLSTATALLY
ncbi:TPA: hypothetical protein ACGJ37_000420 [Pseudomonas aeruginosa]|nr:hypothetical protein [Pseudomonas aeruginosa]